MGRLGWGAAAAERATASPCAREGRMREEEEGTASGRGRPRRFESAEGVACRRVAVGAGRPTGLHY
eukprot:scaffold1883_cov396-Prasinococcus_capsulatus_cf.AAC.42